MTDNASFQSTDSSNDLVFSFLEYYQTEPVIWDPKHKFHKDRRKVTNAWERISKEMNIPVPVLKKKKDALMATFRQHLRRKKSSIKSGAGTEDVYKPVWFAYDIMESFLLPVYTANQTINTESQVSVGAEFAFAMKGRWEDERTVKFVQLYREHELLWNCNDENYKNRKAGVRSLASIARAMKMANFGPADVSRKIKNLRSTYAQEVRKIVKSTSGPPEDIYTPAMPWFPIMDYIIRHNVPGKAGGRQSGGDYLSVATAMGEPSSAPPEALPAVPEPHLEFPAAVTQLSPKRNERTQTPTDVESCYDLSYAPSNTDRIEHVESRYPDMELTERPGGVAEDTLDLFGRYVSSILRQLPVNKSYTLQQKFINEAISAKLLHEQQCPSKPPCQNGTLPTTCIEITETSDIGDNPKPSDATNQKRKRKRKSTSPCLQPSSPITIKEEVEENELSNSPRGDNEITDTIMSEDCTSIEFEEVNFCGIKSEIEESYPLSMTPERNDENMVADNTTERLQPTAGEDLSSSCTRQPSSRQVSCSQCSIQFKNGQELRNHNKEQHPGDPHTKTDHQNIYKRRCIETGSPTTALHSSPAISGLGSDNIHGPFATLGSSSSHKDLSFPSSSSNQEPNVPKHTNIR